MNDAAKRERRGLALARETFVSRRKGIFDQVAVDAASSALRTKNATLPKSALAKGFPTGDIGRWVPIGPAVVRRGQANDRPRVTGRIRDLAVHPLGVRAYAATGQGGLWYTGDGGATWDPVGGWSVFGATRGGDNFAQSCGCVLVDFGAAVDTDFVMVGTGENVPLPRRTGHGRYGGIGVLTSRGPARATRPVQENPWEAATGLALFEGLGFCRLVRRPGRVPGATTAGSPDEVLAATSAGLFLGTRVTVAAPPPAHDEFTWTRLAGIDALAGMVAPGQTISDAVWLPGGRIVVAVDAHGVAFSDNNGTSWKWVTGCAPVPAPGTQVQGFSSLALVPGTNTLYILTGLPLAVAVPPANGLITPRDTPTVMQVADITVAAPVAVPMNPNSTPLRLWGTQRDYDQAIAATRISGTDRIFLAGSARLGFEDWGASMFCFDVAAGPTLVPAPGVSRTGAPAAPPGPPLGGEGADAGGWIGNNVHADVHVLRLAGPAATPHVWVGTDGGVYVSPQGGRVNTFASRMTGLASLQPTFVAAHPTSSHFVATGLQDNGSQVRSGDSLWEEIQGGDGGGLAFHPTRTQFIVTQQHNDDWASAPDVGFVPPTQRGAGHNSNANEAGALFYSGAAAVATSATAGRIALGTSRVWLTDNLGAGGTNRWRVLPFSTGAAAAATDPLADGPLLPNAQNVGVPTLAPGDINGTGFGPLGRVTTVKWVSPTHLLALFDRGVVRWVEAPAGRWTATVLVTPAMQPAATVAAGLRPVFLTDIAPLANGDFYLTTTGDPGNVAIDTCYRFDPVNGLVAQQLRRALPPPPGSPPGSLGPLEPAYSVVVDQVPAPANVYVGTVTGAWRRADGVPPATAWTAFVNGLPQAAVQDLSIWTSPLADAAEPRLLRAAVQARGVWEVDLAHDEPRRTYLRVHPRDDRRRFPTPMRNPRRGPTSAEETAFESPDVVVRPRAGAGIAPRWLLGAGQIAQGTVHLYQLWTFQTAFRWLYPAVVADGRWTDTFGDLVEQHRATLQPTLGAPPLPLGRFIDRRLWDSVVGTTRVDPVSGLPSTNAAHPLAVYRQGWHTAAAQAIPATEVDLLESVQPRSVVSGVWRVHSELSTVDVLLHHRDTRPLPASAAFAILLRLSGPTSAGLLNSTAADLADLAATLAGGGVAAAPGLWQLETGSAATPLHRLPTTLDARLPRAVSVDVDLSGVDNSDFVLFLAIGGSTLDPCTTPAVGLPANPTVRDLARCWPHAALRLVRVGRRL